MRYRKKPVVVEARQFETNNDNGQHINEVAAWADEGRGIVSHDYTFIYIETLEGRMKADVGDWLIKGVKGEVYPCKPDIFAATYEATTDGTG